MRTTIRINDDLLKRAKKQAADEELRFCDMLLAQPHCVIIEPGERHWGIFKRLCTEADARGNLVPDAW